MTTNDKIQGLVVLLKVNDKVHEVVLTTLVKKEVFVVLDKYQIVLVDNDLSGIIKIK